MRPSGFEFENFGHRIFLAFLLDTHELSVTLFWLLLWLQDAATIELSTQATVQELHPEGKRSMAVLLPWGAWLRWACAVPLRAVCPVAVWVGIDGDAPLVRASASTSTGWSALEFAEGGKSLWVSAFEAWPSLLALMDMTLLLGAFLQHAVTYRLLTRTFKARRRWAEVVALLISCSSWSAVMFLWVPRVVPVWTVQPGGFFDTWFRNAQFGSVTVLLLAVLVGGPRAVLYITPPREYTMGDVDNELMFRLLSSGLAIFGVLGVVWMTPVMTIGRAMVASTTTLYILWITAFVVAGGFAKKPRKSISKAERQRRNRKARLGNAVEEEDDGDESDDLDVHTVINKEGKDLGLMFKLGDPTDVKHPDFDDIGVEELPLEPAKPTGSASIRRRKGKGKKRE